MGNYDNTNSGVLFKNDKQGVESRPDYTGRINVGGEERWLSAWVKDGKRGKFMSLAIGDLCNKSSTGAKAQNEPSSQQNFPDDDIPF